MTEPPREYQPGRRFENAAFGIAFAAGCLITIASAGHLGLAPPARSAGRWTAVGAALILGAGLLAAARIGYHQGCCSTSDAFRFWSSSARRWSPGSPGPSWPPRGSRSGPPSSAR